MTEEDCKELAALDARLKRCLIVFDYKDVSFLRRLLAEAEAERDAARRHNVVIETLLSKTLAERDALKTRLDKAMRVVEAARPVYALTERNTVEHNALRDALVALDAEPKT